MLNLLALLVASNQPLTLKRIRHQLAGQYPDGDSAARAAFERRITALIEPDSILPATDAQTTVR